MFQIIRHLSNGSNGEYKKIKWNIILCTEWIMNMNKQNN